MPSVGPVNQPNRRPFSNILVNVNVKENFPDNQRGNRHVPVLLINGCLLFAVSALSAERGAVKPEVWMMPPGDPKGHCLRELSRIPKAGPKRDRSSLCSVAPPAN